MRMAVSISINLSIMKITMFSIRSASKLDYEVDNDNHIGSLWKHMVVTITLNMFQMR